MSIVKANSLLKFTPATVGSPIPQLDNRTAVSNDESSRPIVLLYGWMGSQMPHLQKYALKWNEKGYNTFAYCPTTSETFITPARSKCKKMMDQIKEYLNSNPNCQSLIIHAFSNGGGFYYFYTLELLMEHKDYKYLHRYVKGSVLDSLPTLSLKSAIEASKVSAGALFSAFLAIFIVPIIYIAMRNFMISYRDHITHSKNKWQHLVFYSKNDKLVKYDQVTEFLKIFRNNHKNHQDILIEQCFEDSPHVLHLRQHPEVYMNRIDQFLTRIKEASSSVSSSS
ncbi:hypothetical protein DFA_10081 [Cavenderia fasciculata]|uniref:Transmembrane protein n=1 Tax=Cavenderia fasciculata TaxID=261658 RepID=F4Q978_CACFS|nr:uncharacterized protein DFA_10081 [Cavenderia fasciculata]EGG15247.1 hypothetical protein DFA_10081 [Cavenderia fasciculata]|eukprot:XP_004351967.1 hypothetical protein DFA_10081 [Cavenderia fasciculata]